MGDFVEVGKVGQIRDGAMQKVVVRGREVLLARVGNRFYAADNLCPHLKGNLSAGNLEGTIVTCPVRGSRFDLADGRVVRWLEEPPSSLAAGEALRPPRSLRTYAVRTEGDTLLIEIGDG
jgi:3-phenylpropionate/trans-cinnamate dioxygenase ferredoxin subunit